MDKLLRSKLVILALPKLRASYPGSLSVGSHAKSMGIPWVLFALNKQCGCAMKTNITTIQNARAIAVASIARPYCLFSTINTQGKVVEARTDCSSEYIRLSLTFPECRFEIEWVWPRLVLGSRHHHHMTMYASLTTPYIAFGGITAPVYCLCMLTPKKSTGVGTGGATGAS